MSKRKSSSTPEPMKTLKNPWPIVTGILFCLLLAVTLFFLVYGIQPEIDSHMLGNVGISMETNSAGEVVLYPTPGHEAEKAGVQNFDILLKINGRPLSKTINMNDQLRGQVGQPLIITVRKSDGSEKTYSIVRSSDYQNILSKAGLSVGALTAFLTGLSLLVGLGFTALGGLLMLRRFRQTQFILTAFVLVLLPYSLNAISVMFHGVTLAHLEWLYSLLRSVGLFLASLLVFVFPNGEFFPKWIRWSLIGVGIWAILYSIALINPTFLPGSGIDLVWMLIMALGLALQVFRYRSNSKEGERLKARRVGIALLAGLVVYVIVWILSTFLPTTAFSEAGWVWFFMLSELLVDAGFLFFGLRLVVSTQETA
jgi:hypothetical protein